MKKRTLALALCAVLALALLSGCGGKTGATLKVGASPTPHQEILEDVVKELLAKEGITLEVVAYDDYVFPNNHVEDGQLDANYFQHITYMNEFNESSGTHLVSVAGIHYEPLGIYPGKTASLDALADKAVIAIPNDATNGGRALLLLQQEGLIKLKDGVGLTPTVSDIAENPHSFDIKELKAELLTTTLKDVDVAVINGNYALGAGLKAEDALAFEADDGAAAEAYVNVLAVKEGRENDDSIKALAKALQSPEVKEYIEKTYGGGVVALF